MLEKRTADLIESEPREFLVACLCAEWCGTCRDYRVGFDSLPAKNPDAHFIWVDIEDDADWAGNFDVEDFPSIVVQRGELVLFYGPMLPQLGHLQRQLDALRKQTAEEARQYASGNDERRSWQDLFNVRAALRDHF
ncbi:MAG: thioredoxin [Betaproteobacteria bacterium]|nr:thioredoxin [Betaproteobacteria bacterium]